jgi:adenylyl-sulfate kinase
MRRENVIDTNQRGFILWFTGMSGAGKTTISCIIHDRLRAHGLRVELLDGDMVRQSLCKDLKFSKEDRDENVRRIGFVAELLSRNGIIAIVAAISPYRALREEIRSRSGTFVEVYVSCPMDVLLSRDVKGLYKRALAGEIKDFTGISSPYEPPLAPELTIDSSGEEARESAAHVWSTLWRLGLVGFQFSKFIASPTVLS